MHSFVPDSDAPAGLIDPAHTRAIKQWVTDMLQLGPDDVVSVMESACVDPGCPLVETHVVVFGADGSTRRWRLTRQRYAIARFIVEQALRSPPAPS